jgi:hypothetical protein
MMIRRVCLLLVLIVVMAAESASGLRHVRAGDAQEAGAAQDGPEANGGVEVALIEPGSLPRQVIRFRPAKGEKQKIIMTMKMNQAIRANGQVLPSVDFPAQQVVLDLSVADVSEEGDIRFDFLYSAVDVVDDPENPSPVAALMRQSLQPMVGTTGSAVVTNRGLSKKAELNVPPEVSPQVRAMLDGMKDSLNRISSPVPVEPIGVGGRWRVVQHVAANGIRLRQVSIHELKNVSDDGFALDIQITQAAGSQTFRPPGLAEGSEVLLESLSTTATGETLLSGDSIVPRHARMAMRSKMKMKVNAQPEQQSMEVDMQMEMTIGPSSPAP